MKRLNWANTIWMVAYLVVIIYVVMWMFRTREDLRFQNADRQTRSDWQTWRDDVRDQQSTKAAEQPGHVERKVPKSVVPPVFVLMENHFVTMLISAVIAASLLFGLLVFSVKGVLARAALPAADLNDDNPNAGETPEQTP